MNGQASFGRVPAGGGHLTNILPGSFAQFYEDRLPEAMLGGDFLQKYGSHYDTATEVGCLWLEQAKS